jgi:hypothetical protein
MEDGLNVYIYVQGNPVNRLDPDGRETSANVHSIWRIQ